MLILKQPDNDEKSYIETIENEANFYSFLREENILLDSVGEFKHFDSENKILIQESSLKYDSIESDTLTDKEKISKFIEGVTHILSQIHDRFENNEKLPSYFDTFKPTLLDKYKRPLLLEDMKKSRNKSLKDLANKIESIKDIIESIEWIDNETIIHRDIRYQNFIYNSSESKFKLIDWEMAATGDSCWDIVTFCSIIFKSIAPIGPNSLNTLLTPKNAYIIIKRIIEAYYIKRYPDKGPLPASFLKKVLRLCEINLMETYIKAFLNRGIDEGYFAVKKFTELLDTSYSDNFYLTYLNNKINESY
ncbi:phosphotransferase [Emticicia sp. BO119]|nr:phosphotransferase [Emticicia sp. BO119]